ncbi:MAG: D-amino-acid transaminase [Sphingomonadales bacterium]|nr:D-amino-acid transaminase [Sphingomonadales bacterium]
MSRIAYVNGSYVHHASAAVHVEDRGYQFADAVYEVVAVLNGKILDMEPHLARLSRSLQSLQIAMPMSDKALSVVLNEVKRQNRLRNGILYFQVSRGVAAREHGFPDGSISPSVVVTAKRLNFDAIKEKQKTGISVKTMVETRWARPDIKTVCLLANVLAKAEANKGGATDAWFVDHNGMVTEGTANNAWIIKGSTLITRELSNDILAGITRSSLLEVAEKEGLKIEERSFSVAEAKAADEAFITSTTNFVMPVVSIDGQKIGDGKPGSICQKLIKFYWNYLEN